MSLSFIPPSCSRECALCAQQQDSPMWSDVVSSELLATCTERKKKGLWCKAKTVWCEVKWNCCRLQAKSCICDSHLSICDERLVVPCPRWAAGISLCSEGTERTDSTFQPRGADSCQKCWFPGRECDGRICDAPSSSLSVFTPILRGRLCGWIKHQHAGVF